MGTGRVVDAKRVAESPLSPAGFRPLLWSFVSERGAARRRVLRPAAPVKGPPLLHLKERDPSDSDGGKRALWTTLPTAVPPPRQSREDVSPVDSGCKAKLELNPACLRTRGPSLDTGGTVSGFKRVAAHGLEGA